MGGVRRVARRGGRGGSAQIDALAVDHDEGVVQTEAAVCGVHRRQHPVEAQAVAGRHVEGAQQCRTFGGLRQCVAVERAQRQAQALFEAIGHAGGQRIVARQVQRETDVVFERRAGGGQCDRAIDEGDIAQRRPAGQAVVEGVAEGGGGGKRRCK